MSEFSFPSPTRWPAALAGGVRLFFGLPSRLRRPVARGTYSAEIDGLRFIAIAIVVIGHFMERGTRFFPVVQAELGGNRLAELLIRPGIGVYLFFAISGFILTRQIIKARAAPLSPKFLKTYFGRRVLRIEPPYIVLLIATWFLLAMVGYTPDKTNHFDAVPQSLGASLLGSIFYLHDLVWGTYPRLFPPGWSLEIEVQFYLLAPVLFWAFFKTPRGPARIAFGALGLLGGALLSITAPHNVGAAHTDASIFRFFHFFWLGMVLADLHDWIVKKTAGLSPVLTGWLGWIGLVAYLAIPNAPDDNIGMAMVIRAAMLAALSATFVSAFARGSSFRAFCERPWISVIGGACYSIYLTHLQVIQVMTSLFAKLTPQGGVGLLFPYLMIETAVIVVVGMTFYAVIERTFMIKDWPSQFLTRVRETGAVFMLVTSKLRS